MKKLLAALALTLLVAAALPTIVAHASASPAVAQPTPAAGLIPYTSKEGAFSAKLPAEPKTSSEDIDTAIGKVALHMFTVETNNGNDAYMIEYSDFSIVPSATDAVDAAINGQVGSFKGKITADKKVILNGWPGRTVVIEGPDATCYSSAYLAEKRLYQVMFVMMKGQTLPSDVPEFLSSFQITNAAPAK